MQPDFVSMSMNVRSRLKTQATRHTECQIMHLAGFISVGGVAAAGGWPLAAPLSLDIAQLAEFIVFETISSRPLRPRQHMPW